MRWQWAASESADLRSTGASSLVVVVVAAAAVAGGVRSNSSLVGQRQSEPGPELVAFDWRKFALLVRRSPPASRARRSSACAPLPGATRPPPVDRFRPPPRPPPGPRAAGGRTGGCWTGRPAHGLKILTMLRSLRANPLARPDPPQSRAASLMLRAPGQCPRVSQILLLLLLLPPFRRPSIDRARAVPIAPVPIAPASKPTQICGTRSITVRAAPASQAGGHNDPVPGRAPAAVEVAAVG